MERNNPSKKGGNARVVFGQRQRLAGDFKPSWNGTWKAKQVFVLQAKLSLVYRGRNLEDFLLSEGGMKLRGKAEKSFSGFNGKWWLSACFLVFSSWIV
jgi:hypothetical protein